MYTYVYIIQRLTGSIRRCASFSHSDLDNVVLTEHIYSILDRLIIMSHTLINLSETQC